MADEWTLLENLLLVQAVYKYGEDSWLEVASKLSRHSLLKRNADFFSQQSCSAQYNWLLQNINIEIKEDTPAVVQIAEKLYMRRINEITQAIKKDENDFQQLVEEIDSIRSGEWDEKLTHQGNDTLCSNETSDNIYPSNSEDCLMKEYLQENHTGTNGNTQNEQETESCKIEEPLTNNMRFIEQNDVKKEQESNPQLNENSDNKPQQPDMIPATPKQQEQQDEQPILNHLNKEDTPNLDNVDVNQEPELINNTSENNKSLSNSKSIVTANSEYQTPLQEQNGNHVELVTGSDQNHHNTNNNDNDNSNDNNHNEMTISNQENDSLPEKLNQIEDTPLIHLTEEKENEIPVQKSPEEILELEQQQQKEEEKEEKKDESLDLQTSLQTENDVEMMDGISDIEAKATDVVNGAETKVELIAGGIVDTAMNNDTTRKSIVSNSKAETVMLVENQPSEIDPSSEVIVEDGRYELPEKTTKIIPEIIIEEIETDSEMESAKENVTETASDTVNDSTEDTSVESESNTVKNTIPAEEKDMATDDITEITPIPVTEITLEQPSLAEQETIRATNLEPVNGTKLNYTEETHSEPIKETESEVAKEIEGEMVLDVDSEAIKDTDSEIKPEVTGDVMDLDLTKEVDQEIISEPEIEAPKETAPNVTEIIKPDMPKETEPEVVQVIEPEMLKETEPEVAREIEPKLIEDSEPEVTEESETAKIKEVDSEVKQEGESEYLKDNSTETNPDSVEESISESAENAEVVVEPVISVEEDQLTTLTQLISEEKDGLNTEMTTNDTPEIDVVKSEKEEDRLESDEAKKVDQPIIIDDDEPTNIEEKEEVKVNGTQELEANTLESRNSGLKRTADDALDTKEEASSKRSRTKNESESPVTAASSPHPSAATDDDVGGSTSTPTQNKNTKDDIRQKTWQKTITLLWQDIANHKNGTMFMNPIKKSNAPLYYRVVKQPLDLKSIKNRVRDGIVKTTEEFERDIILMLTNSLMYNKEGTEVYQLAFEMLQDVQEQIRLFKSADTFEAD